jgi:hypothetical protein
VSEDVIAIPSVHGDSQLPAEKKMSLLEFPFLKRRAPFIGYS